MKTTDALPAKAPRSVCRLCGLGACGPIVVDGKCTNAGACARRVKNAAKRAAQKPPVKKATP